MSHVFVAPHSDDVALSCGGLIAALRASGETISIVTVYSGAGSGVALTPYQREALGFEGASGRGTLVHAEVVAAHEIMAERREEDREYAWFNGASVSHLDLPDAVFRGYESDDALLGSLRADDPCPIEILRDEIAYLEPERVYFPLGIGGHVDHQQVRNAGLALLVESRRWSTSSYLGRMSFYEDVPYAYSRPIEGLEDLPNAVLAMLPADIVLAAEYADIAPVLSRKIEALRVYDSQLDRLFGGPDAMEDVITRGATRTGAAVGLAAAERYWRAQPVRQPDGGGA